MDREVDFWQLTIVTLTRMKTIVVFTIMGACLAALFFSASAGSDIPATAYEEYERELAYYDRLNGYYEKWEDRMFDTLEKKLEGDSHQDESGLEEEFYETEILYYIPLIRSNIKSLNKPTMPVATSKSIISSISRILVGAVFGFFVGCICVAVVTLFFGVILSANELVQRYDIHLLAGLSMKSKSGILKMGRDRAFIRMDKGEQVRIATANISVYAPGVKRVLIVSSLGGDILNEAVMCLQNSMHDVQVVFASNINENAESYEKLKQYEDVIILEEVLSSRCDEVDNELRLVSDWKKNIIGLVAVL